MNTIHIREAFDKSVDFMKAHYEYILPFSLLFILLQLPPQFIPSTAMTIYTLLLIPLGLSIPYFADSVQRGQEKKFSTFFEIYRYSGKIFGVTIIKCLIILLLVSPFLYVFMDTLKEYDYDMQKINQAIQLRTIELPTNTLSMFGISLLLLLFCMPFILFNEYFAVLNNMGILESFQKSYEVGVRNYFKIFGVVIVSMIFVMLGFLACGIGLIFAFPMVYLLYYFAFRQVA